MNEASAEYTGVMQFANLNDFNLASGLCERMGDKVYSSEFSIFKDLIDSEPAIQVVHPDEAVVLGNNSLFKYAGPSFIVLTECYLPQESAELIMYKLLKLSSSFNMGVRECNPF